MRPPLSTLKILVLAGGPDRERPVSLVSGEQVASALTQRGHDIRLRDILPDNLAALDEFTAWRGDAIFLAMHGSWGEGGELQRILEQRGLPYFGCDSRAAALCMDKNRTKQRLREHGLPTPDSEVIAAAAELSFRAPLVLKPLLEGSSIGVAICKDEATARAKAAELSSQYGQLLVERFIRGAEMTVGVIGSEAMPPVQIIPATEFYDYEAKYLRDDTRYVFDALPPRVLDELRKLAVAAHQACGCRHLSRVDFMVDEGHRPYILEINTIPGFTSHSLVPKCAAHAGIDFPTLCDRLARLAVRNHAAAA